MNLSEWSAWALDLVRVHHAWGGAVCFVLAFCESLAFLSLLVPATVILIGIGGLVPLSDLSFAQIWLGAAAGAAGVELLKLILALTRLTPVHREVRGVD